MSRRPDHFARLLGVAPSDAVRVTAFRRPFAGIIDEGPVEGWSEHSQAPATRQAAAAPQAAFTGAAARTETAADRPLDFDEAGEPGNDHLPVSSQRSAGPEHASSLVEALVSDLSPATEHQKSARRSTPADLGRHDHQTIEPGDVETPGRAPPAHRDRPTPEPADDAPAAQPELIGPAHFVRAEPKRSFQAGPPPSKATSALADAAHDTVEIGPIEIVLMPPAPRHARRRERRPMSRGPAVFGLRQG